METVQEQQLRLQMKFLLGYSKKIVALRWWEEGGGVKIRWNIFPGEGRLSKAFAHDGILMKLIFAIKASQRRNFLQFHFHCSQTNSEICGNDFYVP